MTHDQAISQGDLEFQRAFESCGIAPAAFDHEAHLRLAYVYLAQSGLEDAQAKMRVALIAFLRVHGLPPGKFHETLTRAWVLAVRHFMGRSPSRSFGDFIAKSAVLLDSRVMLTHYSPGALFSEQARAVFVEPDLDAIPA